MFLVQLTCFIISNNKQALECYEEMKTLKSKLQYKLLKISTKLMNGIW